MPLLLTDADKLSPTYLKIKEHFEERLRSFRAQLPDMVAKEMTGQAMLTAGRIAEIRDFLSVGNEEAIRPLRNPAVSVNGY